jgi:hypothetical protein
MADKKISALTSLAQGDVAVSTDVLPIVDTSATETKKVTAAALVGAGLTAGVTNVDINSGSIDGTTIGANSAAAGTFTNLTASGTVSFSGATVSNGGSVTTVDINGGTIDGTSVGASSASTGSFTTLTTSSTVTLNGGTANGVLYLNGSKVATSGSALTYNGTTLEVSGFAGNNALRLTRTATDRLDFYQGGGVSYIDSSATSGQLAFATEGSERMRLTSTGLGIGTSSPGSSYRVTIQGAGTSGNPMGGITFRQGSTDTMYIGSVATDNNTDVEIFNPRNGYLRFVTNNTERMRLDSSGNLGITSGNLSIASGSVFYLSGSGGNAYLQESGGTLFIGAGGAGRVQVTSSGNLGLGVSPSAWGSGAKSLEGVGGALTFFDSTNDQLWLTQNAFWDGAWKYKTTNFASSFQQYLGQHVWFTAPSGTAGNTITFTQAMTLDASGNLLLGATAQAFAERFRMNGGYAVFDDASYTGFIGRGTALGTGTASDFAIRSSNALAFLAGGATERARITSGGDLLVGNTASVQTSRAEFTSTSLTPAFLARVNVDADEGQWAGQFQKKTATSTTSQIFVRFLINDGATASGYITANGANAATFTSSSDSRLKENIAELPSQWGSIKALRPVEFDYIESEGGGHQVGFIAQDFEQVYPDSVGERPDGMKMLSGWSKTEARMVKALQEAMARIEKLEAEVAALKGV